MTTEEIIKDIFDFSKPPKEYYGKEYLEGSIWHVTVANKPAEGFEYCNYEIFNIDQASEIWNKMSPQIDFIKDNIDVLDIDENKQLYYVVINHYSQELRKNGVELPETTCIK